MTCQSLLAVTSIVLIGVCSALADSSQRGGRSLLEAVKEVNAKATESAAGSGQLPLTVKEVIAALRAIDRAQWRSMDEETYNMYQQIAETAQLPEYAKFRTMSQHTANGYDFTVWRVDLLILRQDLATPKAYGYPIRNRMISSAPARVGGDRAKPIDIRL